MDTSYGDVFSDEDFLWQLANTADGVWCGEVSDHQLVDVGRAIPRLFPAVCEGLERHNGRTGSFGQIPSTEAARAAHQEAVDYLAEQTKGPAGKSFGARVGAAKEFTQDAAGFYCPLKPGEE